MDIYRPTYLYVKRHSITGLRYFGKTTKHDPYSYKGSGKRWLNHIKKHGTQYVETLWVKLFSDEAELVSFAKQFSTENDIVESTSWANLCIETGLDGGPRKNNHFRVFNKIPKTEKIKSKISSSLSKNQNRSIRVVYDGEIYSSTVILSNELNVCEQTIRNWKKKGLVKNLE